MDMLSVFALIVLLTLLLTIGTGALVTGWQPGRIAKRRGHQQAEAVALCLGPTLANLAFITLFTVPAGQAWS